MNRQKIFFIIAAFLLGIGGMVLYQFLRDWKMGNFNTVATTTSLAPEECDQFTTTEDCKTISLATSTWKVFENTKYGYAISYPSEGYVTSRDDYGGAENIYFGIPGKTDLGGVDTGTYFNLNPNLNLKLYAEAIRNLQVNDPDPYVKDRKIGELKETTIDGRKAYQFTISKGYISSNSNYVIPNGDIYMYTVTEDSKRQKIIIYYHLGNPIAEIMYRTFVFR